MLLLHRSGEGILNQGALNSPVRLMHCVSRRGPVTSVEWCPFESSVLTTTSGDGQLVVWDLALERDPEEEAALVASMNAASPDDLPAQLLFVHLGQVCPMPPVGCPHHNM